MTASQLLRHLHLPGTTPFARASALQNVLVRQHLDYKAQISASKPPSANPTHPPNPAILTFSPTPVYTTGRRELGTISASTISRLQEALPDVIERGGLSNGIANGYEPEVKETLRGGQITYHGPGQLVIYPILDLKAIKSALWPRGLSVRCYVNILEQATIHVLQPFGIHGIRTANPGVWVSEDKKIAALGVHLRRNVASYGVGLNVRTDLRYFDKIVACGLEGKKTTSIKQELWRGKTASEWVEGAKNREGARAKARYHDISNRMELARIAKNWSKEFGRLVWGDEAVLEMLRTREERVVAKFLDRSEGRSHGRELAMEGSEDGGGIVRKVNARGRDTLEERVIGRFLDRGEGRDGHREWEWKREDGGVARKDKSDTLEEWLEDIDKEDDIPDRRW